MVLIPIQVDENKVPVPKVSNKDAIATQFKAAIEKLSDGGSFFIEARFLTPVKVSSTINYIRDSFPERKLITRKINKDGEVVGTRVWSTLIKKD